MIKRVVRRLRVTDRSSIPSGFTLIEILVSLIVASIVVSGLLYLVVELLQIDRREAFLDETQRNMQRSIDYMADDLREALYVYSTPTTITGQLTGNGFPATGAVPILAFWKPKPLDEDVTGGTIVYDLLPPGENGCNTLGTAERANCNALKIRQSFYELVVYYVTDDVNPTWEGKSRIVRYSLPEYNTATLATTVVPTDVYAGNSPAGNFAGWVPVAGASFSGSNQVLVDYVGALDQTDPPPACGTGYESIPSTANTSESFSACVRPFVSNDLSKQDVLVYLKGDAAGASNRIINSFSERSQLPAIQTRVLIRGVLDKDTSN